MTKRNKKEKLNMDRAKAGDDFGVVTVIGVDETDKINESNKDIVQVDAMQSVVAGVSTADLKKALDIQTEQRKLINDFIKKHLKTGVDFLRIHVVKGCQQEEKKRGSCKNSYHFSKDILAKPGQEKIFSLLGITSELVKDEETMDMLAGTKGLVAYKCIAKRGDQIVAEGRGAATVGEKYRDANATIKIAEKRARMDACLSLGFSEYFAQDLDDPDYKNQKEQAQEMAANQADDGTGLPPRPAKSLIDDQERTVLVRLMIKLGINARDEQLNLLAANGISEPKEMTSGMARDMIRKLRTNAFVSPVDNSVFDDAVVTDDPDTVDLSKSIDETTAKNLVAETPPLDVDHELKEEIIERLEKLGLNEYGKNWIQKTITGRPFGTFDKYTDAEWRRAYDVIEAINEGKINIEDHHVKGVVSAFPEGKKR